MKALYVDFDGTLTTDRYWRSLPSEQHNKLQKLLFSEDRSMVRDWMRGKYSAEEVNQYAAKELNMSYDELWDLFVEDCRSMYIPESVFELISKLSQSYKLVLITGNMDSFTRFTVSALKLESYFDHISNSFYEGKHKTANDGELFLEWSNKLEIPLKESVLIDDQEKCCQTFSNLGGAAHQTKSIKNTEEILSQLLQETL